MKHLTKKQIEQIADMWSDKEQDRYPDFIESDDVIFDRYKESILNHAFQCGVNFYKQLILNSEENETNNRKTKI
jgi:hypothetical protein